jgi:hypothetical protein
MNRTKKMMTGVLALLVSSTAACSTHTPIHENYSTEETSFDFQESSERNQSYEQTDSYQESDIISDPEAEEIFPIEEPITDSGGHIEESVTEVAETSGEEYTEDISNEPPSDSDCSYWEWDEETEAYYCGDTNSSHASHYFYGGHYYPNQHALISSTHYQSSKNSFQSSSSGSYKSGIGSGTAGGFGG